MKERYYYLGFSNFSGIGPKKFDLLLRTFGSSEKAWNTSFSDLERILKPSLASKFELFREEFDIYKYAEKLEKQKVSYVCLKDVDYPSLLKKIPNPPIVIYMKGNLDLFHSQILKNIRMIAIVGTRHITTYGREITQMFASELAAADMVIVSGMAYGVDAVAHKATIDAKGKTIAVLGNGVDQAYPRENQKLYEEILDANGLIISEYPPGAKPSVGSFPARNRIVAGLSDGVLVTEGAQDSGSLITANFGLEFGRKVFAVPGPITSSLSAAPLKLIEKGAKLVVSPGDVIKELGVKPSEITKTKKNYEGLDLVEKKIVMLIENESMGFDEIVRRLGLETSKAGSLLTVMEIKGLIKNSGGKYSVNLNLER